MVKKLIIFNLFANSYGTMISTWYILWASREQQEVSNHVIQENFTKSREISHNVQGILCKGLASMDSQLSSFNQACSFNPLQHCPSEWY